MGERWSACLWLRAWFVCGAVLACLCRSSVLPRGLAVVFLWVAASWLLVHGASRTVRYHRTSCGGAVVCGVRCSGGLGVGIRGCMAAWLWVGSGIWHGRAWSVPRLGWAWRLWWVDCAFLYAHDNTDAATPPFPILFIYYLFYLEACRLSLKLSLQSLRTNC